MKNCPVQIKLTKPLSLMQVEFTWLSKGSLYLLDNYKLRMHLCWLIIEWNILPIIKNIIVKSILSVKLKLNPSKLRSQMEIFGYDFMIDSDNAVWLIEVNTNPCLEESSNLLKSLLPRMIDDAFKITLDKVFKETKKNIENVKYPIKGYDDDFNMWYY